MLFNWKKIRGLICYKKKNEKVINARIKYIKYQCHYDVYKKTSVPAADWNKFIIYILKLLIVLLVKNK